RVTSAPLSTGTRAPIPDASWARTAARLETVDVDAGYEERYWYPDDGGQVWVAGYQLVDPGSGRYLARDAPELAARGLRVVGVAGAGRHHADALPSDARAPGNSLAL